MNDRFKSRAFHKPTKRMFEVYCFTDEHVFENTLDGVGTSPTNPANIEDCILEQCTGLKDKNGQLIYEGDIVESTIATRNNKSARDIIKYNNEFAGFEPMCLYDCDCGIYNPADELVIVGNIHENPELMEDK